MKHPWTRMPSSSSAFSVSSLMISILILINCDLGHTLPIKRSAGKTPEPLDYLKQYGYLDTTSFRLFGGKKGNENVTKAISDFQVNIFFENLFDKSIND